MKGARCAERFVLFTGVPLLMACSTPERPFQPLRDIDRVVIVDRKGRQIRTIVDSARVAAIVDFVNARADGWVYLWWGTPIAAVNAQFRGATFQGTVGATFHGSRNPDSGYLTTQRDGRFAARPASRSEIEEFAKLLETPVPRELR